MTTPIELIINGRDNTRGAFTSAAGSISRIGQIAAGILASQVFLKLGQSIVGFATSAITEAREAALVQADLEAVLKSTGGVAGVTAEMVGKLSTSISENSKFTDEDIKKAEILLLTFTNIGKDIFPQATQATADLAARFGMDLSSASVMLGKALNDPIEGMSALSRNGITFSEEQKKMIKTMQEAGNIAGAQGIIMEEVGRQTAGAAESQVTAWDKLRKKFDNVKERIGTALLPALDRIGNVLSAALDNPKVQAAIEGLTKWFSETAPRMIDKVLEFLRQLRDGEWFNVFEDGTSRIGAFFANMGAKFVEFTQGIKDKVAAIDWEGVSQKLIEWIQSIDWQQLGNDIATGIGNLATTLADIVSRIDWIGIFSAIGLALWGVLTGIGEVIAEAWGPAIEQMGITIELLKGIIQEKFEEIKLGIQTKIEEMKTGIANKFDEIKDAITNKVSEWVSALLNKVSEFFEVGAQIVTAIIDGLYGAWDELIQILMDLIAELIETVLGGIIGGLGGSANALALAPVNAGDRGFGNNGNTNNFNNAPIYNFGTIIRGDNGGFKGLEAFG